MDLTQKSRLLSGPAARGGRPEVRPHPTAAALGSSRIRGAAAPARRKPFAGPALAALVAVVGLTACDPRLQGNGVYAEKTVDLAAFTGVRTEDGVGAVITVEPGLSQAVKVIGDENLVQSHIRTSLEVEGVGSAALTVLHVWVDPADFQPVIPPKVVVSRPTFSLARGRDGVSIELKRPAGSTAVGGPLVVGLEGASLNARQYPTGGAAVVLSGGSTALLHSDGPVTGSVSADSHLDNTAGLGPCFVPTTAAGNVVCSQETLP
jgi:hypothetical protein